MTPPNLFHDIRPWGEELWLSQVDEAPSMVKLITVNPGQALSLQYHNERSEHWTVISGDGTAQIGTERVPLLPGVTCFVQKEAHHRITGGKDKLVLIELAFGRFDESDIVRLEDAYGRVTSKAV